MWKNFEKRIAAWIPKHISVKLIVRVYAMLAFFCYIGKKKRNSHFNHNLEELSREESPLKAGYIDNQNDWKNVSFGSTTMAFAGCEIIAVYNALRALGHGEGGEMMSQIISDFERKGAALRGWIGSSPLSVKKYLEKRGIRTKLIWKEEALQDNRVTVVTVFNDKNDLYEQIHTMAIIKEVDGYVAYNGCYAIKKCEGIREAIEAASPNPKLICAIELVE